MEQILIQLVSGAVGGNVFGKLFKNFSLGTLGNSIAGILGGGIGGQIMGLLGLGASAAAGSGAAEGGLDLGAILTQVGAGGAGGGALMLVIGMVKKAMSKSA